MPTANNHSTDISVIVAKNGHVLVFQGFHQALFIQREQLPRFIEDPQQAAMLVIPKFAAIAIAAYTAGEDSASIELTRDLSLGSEFSLVITSTRGPKVAYYSDHEYPIGPRALAKQGIGVAITSRAVVAVDQSGSNPSLSPVASIPHPQEANYPMRFAADPSTIKVAVQDALYKFNSTQHYAS